MLKAARAHGSPMMVMAITTAAMNHASAIQAPPKTIHRTLSKRLRADIVSPRVEGALCYRRGRTMNKDVGSDASIRQFIQNDDEPSIGHGLRRIGERAGLLHSKQQVTRGRDRLTCFSDHIKRVLARPYGNDRVGRQLNQRLHDLCLAAHRTTYS